CDVVTGGTGAAAMLEQLYRSGLFLETLDVHRTQFRYQRLFGEFLRHQLHLVDPGRERKARLAAAGWYEEHEDITAAIHHLLAVDEASEAVQLVLRHGEHFAASDRIAEVRTWMRLLPDHALTDDLRQMMEVGRLCVMTGLRDEALMWLDRAAWRVNSLADPALTAELSLLRIYVRAHRGQLEAATRESEVALEAAAEAAEVDPTLLARIHHITAAVHAALDQVDGARWHRDAAPRTDENDLLDTYSAWLSYRMGNLERALEHAADGLARSEVPWYWSTCRLTKGAVLRERNQLDQAEAELVEARTLAQRWSRPLISVLAAMELAQIRGAQGRVGEALDILAEARTGTDGTNLRQRLDVTQASLLLAQGDMERCLLLRRELSSGRETALLDIRLALTAGQINQAIELLEGKFEAMAQSTQDRISARLLQARARVTIDESAALANLRAAVDLGRPEGFVQVFAPDLAPLEPLLRRLAADNDDPYLFSLLAATAETRSDPVVVPAMVEALSTREQIVLRYLPTALSNKEIAAQLHVSVNTLKSHLKNINRKLGTSSRIEAVSAARGLRLL
ncbi:MAG TPA: LuxR C-terminal-related transcriptional regulator, partial [Acidimicrobiales bacterium]